MNIHGLKEGTAMEQVLEVLGKAATIQDPRMMHMDLTKAATFAQSGSATSGLTFYDLEAGAKFLYPVLTPLRNEIPRVSGKGGIQASWRAVTGINTSGVRVGVSGGHRGAVMQVTTQDYVAAYRGIGIESSADFEAQYAAQNFDDVRAIAAKSGLEALMLGEEILDLGGNGGGIALGTTPQPAGSASTTGGALAAATYSVICVALTLEGHINSTVAGGIPTSVSRTNADGSTDVFGGGSAQKSAARSLVVGSGTTGSLACTVAAVRGAVSYAWFWGASGSELLGAITTIPAITIVADAAGTQNASAASADNSVNALSYDGLLTQALKAGSGAYWKDLAGAGLTSDNAGGVVEIDVVLQDRWDNYRLSPDTIWMNSQEMLNIGKKILSAGSTGAWRVVVNPEQGAMVGGIVVATYLNKFTMGGANVLKVRLHPNMPAGTILFTTSKIPYPMANVGNIMQIRTRQDYYQIEWPLVTRQYQYGVYADQVLQHYFPPSMAVLTGIGNS